MSHRLFLELILLKVALALASVYFFGFVMRWSLAYAFVAGVVVLVTSLVSLYYMVAGGYRISDNQIQDTLKDMRG